MNINEFYPAALSADTNTFNALMRSLLIKASFDGVLKRITNYKGMYLSEEDQECWTLKFENYKGVFGLVLSNVQDKDSGYLGKFNLYYFPSPDDKYLSNSSLLEEYMASQDDFIEKVRSFSSHAQLLNNFYIGSLELFVDEDKNNFFVSYEVQNRDKTYSKDGILDTHNLTSEEYILKPMSVDKNFPSFKIMFQFFNFFNTLLTRLNKKEPDYFEIYKAKNEKIYYSQDGSFEKMKNPNGFKLFLSLGYGDFDFSSLEKDVADKQKIKHTHILHRFMEKSSWATSEVDFEKYNKIFKNNSLKPKLILVTGFLGSGKTKFLQNYIEYENAKNRFVGIIQNEIGKVGLDGQLLDYDYSLVEIDEGCVCCSLAGQLKVGVATLMANSKPDTILVETTGVANPFNLLSELNELDNVVEFDSIVSVIDGVNALKLWDEFSIFKDQVRAADVILLNKTDLMNEDEIKQVEKLLTDNNKCANIIKTVNCDINPSNIANSSRMIKSSTSHIATMFTEETPAERTHIQDGISSKKIDITEPICKDLFESYLEAIPEDIFRIKGIVEFKNFENQFVVQFVNGRYDLKEIEKSKGKDNFLVYIGKNIDQYNLMLS